MFGTLGMESGRGSDREQGFSDTGNSNFRLDIGYLCFPTNESSTRKFISLWVIFLTWVLESSSTLCFQGNKFIHWAISWALGSRSGSYTIRMFLSVYYTSKKKKSGEISQPKYLNYNLCLQLRESHLVKMNGILFWNSKREYHWKLLGTHGPLF